MRSPGAPVFLASPQSTADGCETGRLHVAGVVRVLFLEFAKFKMTNEV